MKTELVVALDMPRSSEAIELINKLPAQIGLYKIGLELFCAEGPSIVRTVRDLERRVFLDLKLHDIPRTVGRAVRAVTALGVEWLTVHAAGGRAMIAAASESAHSQAPAAKILAVTVLTSLNQSDLMETGVGRAVSDQVKSLATLAIESGADGLVCSPHEVGTLREMFGSDVLLVTPGIRPAGNEAADQKRIATPAFAAQAGASAIVVGRPITEAENPKRAAEQILAELAAVGPSSPHSPLS